VGGEFIHKIVIKLLLTRLIGYWNGDVLMEEKKLYLEITYNKVIHKVDQTWEWNLEFGQSVDSDTKMGQHDFSKGRKMQEETQFWPKHEFHATLYVLWRTKNYA